MKNYAVGFRFVDDFLINSYMNKQKIKETLKNYKKVVQNELANPNDPLYKLRTWWLIPEIDLEKIIDELIANIENNKYDLDLYSKIVSYLSRIEEMDVCKSKINTAIRKLEENIKTRKVQGIYYEDRIFDGTQKSEELYLNNIKEIKSLVMQKEKYDQQNEIEGILNSNNWGIKLKEYCKINNSKYLNEKKFAYILNAEYIISNIKNKDIEQIYQFWYSLKNMYAFSNVKEYYENDKDTLIELKQKLENIGEIDKVKKFVVNKIIDFLNDIINKF